MWHRHVVLSGRRCHPGDVGLLYDNAIVGQRQHVLSERPGAVPAWHVLQLGCPVTVRRRLVRVDAGGDQLHGRVCPWVLLPTGFHQRHRVPVWRNGQILPCGTCVRQWPPSPHICQGGVLSLPPPPPPAVSPLVPVRVPSPGVCFVVVVMMVAVLLAVNAAVCSGLRTADHGPTGLHWYHRCGQLLLASRLQPDELHAELHKPNPVRRRLVVCERHLERVPRGSLWLLHAHGKLQLQRQVVLARVALNCLYGSLCWLRAGWRYHRAWPGRCRCLCRGVLLPRQLNLQRRRQLLVRLV